nr:hypothetical protein [Nevskia ramosa]
MAQRAFQFQIITRLKAEGELVTDGAERPRRIGDPCHGRESQACRSADHFQDGRHGTDAADGLDIEFDGPGLQFRVFAHFVYPEAPSALPQRACPHVARAIPI